MSLNIVRAEPVVTGIVSDRRLYLTADEASVVEEGDPTAALLLATPGTVIPAKQVERLGLSVNEGRVALPAAEAHESAGEPEQESKGEQEPKGSQESKDEPKSTTVGRKK